MTRHTPGPWRHGKGAIGNWPIWAAGPDAFGPIGTAWNEADARLMAAAPTLYAALDLIAALGVLSDENTKYKLSLAIDIAQRALAKLKDS